MATIYLDHHATTPVLPEIPAVIAPYLLEQFGNSLSLHSYGQAAQSAVTKAREQVARLFNADAKQTIFTSGSTESIHTAIIGWLLAQEKFSDALIVTSSIEHKATYGAMKLAEKMGAKTATVSVDQEGLLKADELLEIISQNRPTLFTLIHGHNEIGTVQDIPALAEKLAKFPHVTFHVDAAQSAGKINIDFKNTPIHMISLSGHKLYAPKGIGALIVKDHALIRPLFQGGGQEFNLRAGTVNVPGAVGLGFACEWALKHSPVETERLKRLQSLFFQLMGDIPGVRINGSLKQRLPNNINITLPKGDADSISFALFDIAFSAGSACNSGKTENNPVLTAIGLTSEQSKATLRLGLGLSTTEEQVRYVAQKILQFIQKPS